MNDTELYGASDKPEERFQRNRNFGEESLPVSCQRLSRFLFSWIDLRLTDTRSRPSLLFNAGSWWTGGMVLRLALIFASRTLPEHHHALGWEMKLLHLISGPGRRRAPNDTGHTMQIFDKKYTKKRCCEGQIPFPFAYYLLCYFFFVQLLFWQRLRWTNVSFPAARGNVCIFRSSLSVNVKVEGTRNKKKVNFCSVFSYLYQRGILSKGKRSQGA